MVYRSTSWPNHVHGVISQNEWIDLTYVADVIAVQIITPTQTTAEMLRDIKRDMEDMKNRLDDLREYTMELLEKLS